MKRDDFRPINLTITIVESLGEKLWVIQKRTCTLSGNLHPHLCKIKIFALHDLSTTSSQLTTR